MMKLQFQSGQNLMFFWWIDTEPWFCVADSKFNDFIVFKLTYQARSVSYVHMKIIQFENVLSSWKWILTWEQRRYKRFMLKFPFENTTLKIVLAKIYALNCLSKTHSIKNCVSKYRCFKCIEKLSIQSHPSQPEAGVIQSCISTNSNGMLLGSAWVNVFQLWVKYRIRALIDLGSEGTFISECLFNILKLPFERVNVQISSLNYSISARVEWQCRFILGSQLKEDIEITATALIVPDL